MKSVQPLRPTAGRCLARILFDTHPAAGVAQIASTRRWRLVQMSTEDSLFCGIGPTVTVMSSLYIPSRKHVLRTSTQQARSQRRPSATHIGTSLFNTNNCWQLLQTQHQGEDPVTNAATELQPGFLFGLPNSPSLISKSDPLASL